MVLEDLAEKVGLSTSYVQRLENGERNLAVKHFAAFATALGVTPRDLVEDDETPESTVVKVMGKIGAGAEIMPEAEQVPPEGLSQIEVPFPVPENALAFQVDGDSMWPRYDHGDVVLCWRDGANVDEVIGWEAAIMTADGKRYLKRILRGNKPRLFDLESYNAPVIRNVRIEWVSKVQIVVRAGEWRELRKTVQRRIAKKMAS